tara:strand:+ start:2234 stop:2485 length:252 start_codon:yes stop_codon:yes gene_type:complete
LPRRASLKKKLIVVPLKRVVGPSAPGNDTLGPVDVIETTRDGAPPIDLIDGDALITKLMNLGLGVKKTTIECVEVDPTWFEAL